MPVLVSDVIIGAYEDLDVIAVNEPITAAMQTDAFNRLNAILDLLSAEGFVVPFQATQTFLLAWNIAAYTLGAGGTMPTANGLRALKVIAWRATYQNVLQNGGRVLSLAEFGERSRLALGQKSAIPDMVGADTNYPLINVRVSPPPSDTPGSIELAYLTPLPNFATVGDTVTMPQGWLKLLRTALAEDLWSVYPRASTQQKVQQNFAMAKAALMTQNAMTAPQPTNSAPQGQQ